MALDMGTSATLSRQYTVRAPSRDDIPAILALIAACDIASDGVSDPFTEEELITSWRGLDLARDAWLVIAGDGALAGYLALLLHDAEYGWIESDGYVHPEHRGRGIGTALLRLAEARARELISVVPADARVVLQGGMTLADEAAPSLFEHEGFRVARYFWRMAITMDAPPPAPEWPEGVSVRTCERGQDERVFFETLEEAFRDHWGHPPRNYDEWYARSVESSSYDPALWWLATAPDGEPAGAIRCHRQPDGTGWINTLGVRRPWRSRGLGRALLLQAFDAFYRRGVRDVALGVDAQNPTGATRLYERAGMRVVRRYAIYRKVLRPGVDFVEQAQS